MCFTRAIRRAAFLAQGRSKTILMPFTTLETWSWDQILRKIIKKLGMFGSSRRGAVVNESD